jgi:hypothetical protein
MAYNHSFFLSATLGWLESKTTLEWLAPQNLTNNPYGAQSTRRPETG